MLEFSNTTTQIGLIQKCELFTGLGKTGISSNADLLKQFTGLLNDEYGAFVGDILDADGRWQFDDSNHTREPVATFDLVSGQAKYNFTLDQDSNQILRLGYVTVKDNSGDWLDLTPIDISDPRGSSYDEHHETAGTPVEFDISDGVGVKLFPAPNYNSTAGGKVYFQREPSYFASTDTTKKAGFAGPFHVGLAQGASAVWLASKDAKKAKTFFELREQTRESLRNFYSRRNKFEQPKMVAKHRSSR